MSITFACPGCKVQIEVGDEHAGQAGQCPRCERVIAIPSPNQAKPVASAVPVSVPVPAADPWEKPRRVDVDEPPARPRRTRPAPPPPPQPMGPIWPWLVGALAVMVVVGLLFSSFAVLVFWRKSAPLRPGANAGVNVQLPQPQVQPPPPNFGQGVIAGGLDGQRILLANGIFQIRTELHPNDQADPEHLNTRSKRFEMVFQPNRTYDIEMESNQFDCEVRLENFGAKILARSFGRRGAQSASITWRPVRDERLVIYATSRDPAFANFTLTVRERNDGPKGF